MDRKTVGQHRVGLLGKLTMSDEGGWGIAPPKGRTQLRLLVALALKAGEPCSTPDLVNVTWEDTYGRTAGALQTPITHLRKRVPIPKKADNEDYYRLDLARTDVDALDFVDGVAEAEKPEEIDRLLALWRGDPLKLYPFVPSLDWKPLLRARATLLEKVEGMSSVERRRLTELKAFYDRFPELDPGTGTPADGDTEARRRILVVDDKANVVGQITALLSDFECIVAHTFEDALDILRERGATLDGAVVDLHLTDDLDEGGLGVLAYLQSQHPDVPRLLLTRTPPKGSMLDLRRRFGLFDVLVKSGNHSPADFRQVIDEMLGSSADALTRRAVAAFDSHVVTLEGDLKRAVVDARKRMRRGDDLAADGLAHWAAKLEELQEEVRRVREDLETTPPDAAKQVVTEFLAAWRSRRPEIS